MMITRKSMISVAAAAVLVTGFTGCSGGSDTTTSTSTSTVGTVNPNEQAAYTAPIQGLVIDDAGQFVVGAKVTIGDQSTETDSAGQYYFECVDISAYVLNEIGGDDTLDRTNASDGCDSSCLLVSIEPPAGSDMNNVVVGVQPEMIHVADANNAGKEAEVYTVANSQSFTINSQVGTAMLTHKAASAKMHIGNIYNGTKIPEGTKVIAIYRGVNGDSEWMFDMNADIAPGATFANYITGVNNVVEYVDADGMVEFNNLLTSSNYVFLVEGYTWNVQHGLHDVGPIDDSNLALLPFNTYVYQGYAASQYTANLGNLLVVPIINGDEINPRVATILDQYGMYRIGYEPYEPNGASSAIDVNGNEVRDAIRVLMLQRKVKNTMTIMFSEPIVAEDIEENVKVIAKDKNGNNVSFLDIANVDLTGNALTVTLANDLEEGQLFDILVFRDANLEDMSGNPLVFNWAADDEVANALTEGTIVDPITDFDSPAIDPYNCDEPGGCEDAKLEYLSCDVGGRAIVFSLMAYKELMLDAEGATDAVQMELDTDVVRTAMSSPLSALEEYNAAFNNVDVEDNMIDQLNAAEAGPRLFNLGAALTAGPAVTTLTDLDADETRVRFTANNAFMYQITVSRPGATCGPTNPNIVVSEASCSDATAYSDSGFSPDSTWIINGFGADGFTAGEEIELLIGKVAPGDTVTITALNELCMLGNTLDLPLVDNVPPTAVLQNSYIGGEAVGGTASDLALGDGGELIAPAAGEDLLGVPALYITPGLLDDQNEDGNHLDVARTGDETLEHELYVHNHDDSNNTEGVYDATAWEVFALDLARDIGVSFSESLAAGATATYTGTANYRVMNDILTDDIGTFGNSGVGDGPGDAGVPYSRDLVAFTTPNVMTLANVDAGSDMVFSNLVDLAGNTGAATVRVLDGMPPMVTRAFFDGEEIVITFNEDIVITDGMTIMIGAEPLTYVEADGDWTVAGNVLTITNLEGVNAATFDTFSNDYNEATLYGLADGDYPHAPLNTNEIEDTNENSWDSWNLTDKDQIGDDTNDTSNPEADENDLFSPEFAMISAIGEFEVIREDNSQFNAVDNMPEGDLVQQCVEFEFNHEIVTQANTDIDDNENELFAEPGEELNCDEDSSDINDWIAYTSGRTEDTYSFCGTAIRYGGLPEDATVRLGLDGRTMRICYETRQVSEDSTIHSAAGSSFRSVIDPDQKATITTVAND